MLLHKETQQGRARQLHEENPPSDTMNNNSAQIYYICDFEWYTPVERYRDTFGYVERYLEGICFVLRELCIDLPKITMEF